VDIMTTLFDQEKVMEIELYNLAQEKLNEGRAEGRMEGREEGQAAVLRELLKQFSLLDASKMTGIPQEEIKRLTQQN
jgi:predicted transposase YdaD